MNFSQGHSGTKVQCESCLFSQGKTPEFTKMGEIHELLGLALSLVWFAGATPERNIRFFGGFLLLFTNKQGRATQEVTSFLLRPVNWVAMQTLGVPKPACFKSGCLRFLRGGALLCFFCTFYVLLRSFWVLRLHFCFFALFCIVLCPTAFRATAFRDFRKKPLAGWLSHPTATRGQNRRNCFLKNPLRGYIRLVQANCDASETLHFKAFLEPHKVPRLKHDY